MYVPYSQAYNSHFSRQCLVSTPVYSPDCNSYSIYRLEDNGVYEASKISYKITRSVIICLEFTYQGTIKC